MIQPEHQVVIIGAGQAGLATAYHMKRAGLNPLVLEALPQVGDQWRRRWKGLKLFTPNRYNSLPGTPFPGEAYARPDRLEVAQYLQDYVEQHQLDVRTDAAVVSLRQNKSGFHLEMIDGDVLTAAVVIIAGGAYRTPQLPVFAAALPASLQQIHSASLEDPLAYVGEQRKRVLVVGAGASGHQLARLLSAHHDVTLAGNDPGHLPTKFLSRDIYDYLYGLRVLPLRVNSPAGRVLAKAPTKGEIRVGESITASAKRHGFTTCAKLADVSSDACTLIDGTKLALPDVVIWATGYRNTYPFLKIEGALTDQGQPLHNEGCSPVPGLYWMGLHLMRRINSSLLGGVGRDASDLVAQVVTDLKADRQERVTAV